MNIFIIFLLFYVYVKLYIFFYLFYYFEKKGLYMGECEGGFWGYVEDLELFIFFYVKKEYDV